jgi:DNA-binding PucR family transcriptional regulator
VEAGRGELDRFVDRTLGPVLAYDGERGTDLAATLEAYFAAGGNLTRAAGALHVHVNTLYQRLDRVGVLLTPSWQEADGALQVQLALTIRRLRDAVL